MLWLCIHLPLLPLEVFSRALKEALPLAVADGDARRQRLLLVNRAAARQGVRGGQALAAAYALAADLRVLPRDEALERHALAAVAERAGRYSPRVSLEPPAAVLVEIAGSLRLFGGRDTLMERLRADLRALGYRAVVQFAPTPLAALWLARAASLARRSPPEDFVSPLARRRAPALPPAQEGELEARLSPLPLACTDLSPESRALLEGMGVVTLGDCLGLPSAGLARRVGAEFSRALDRALGRLADPRPAYRPPPRFRGRLVLPAEVPLAEGLGFAAQRLLTELEGFLLARGSGVRVLHWRFLHRQRPATRLRQGVAEPGRSAQALLALLRIRLEGLRLAAPVIELRLSAADLEPWSPPSGDLLPSASQADEVPALWDRLRARLGDDAVLRPTWVEEHRPERAMRWGGRSRPGIPPLPPRPLWLLPSPRPLQERAGQPWLDGPLRFLSSEERIESGWWDGEGVRRDYFIVRNRRGERLWIYRCRGREGGWFWHGIYA